MKIRKRFKENVVKLVDFGAQTLWGHIKDGVLSACDEVCGKKMGVEVMEIHGGGMKRSRRQFQGRKVYTRPCVVAVLWRIREGIKA